MRKLVALMIVAVMCPALADAQDCHHYDYFNPIGGVDAPPGTHSRTVAVAADIACVGYEEGDTCGLGVIDISDPEDPQIVGGMELPCFPTEIVIVESLAYLSTGYHFLGNDPVGRLQIIEIANPGSPQIVSELETPGSADGLAVHGQYVYVADGEAGMQVVDISNPTAPQIVASIAELEGASDVAVDGTYAYVTAAPRFEYIGYLYVVDISSPEFPLVVLTLWLPEWANRIVIHDNVAYVACGYATPVAFGALLIFDISDPPGSLETYTEFDNGDAVYSVSYAEDYDYAILSCNPGYPDPTTYTTIVNVSDPTLPVAVGDFGNWGYEIAVTGDLAWATGWSLIDVYDLRFLFPSDIIIGTAVTAGFAKAVASAADYAYVASGSDGLEIFDNSNPSSPTSAGSIDTPSHAWDVTVIGDFAYVADGAAGLQVIDISQPESAHIEGSVDTPGSARGIDVSGAHAYIASGYALEVIDVTDPSSPQLAGSAWLNGQSTDVAVADAHAYVACGPWGLQVVDISAPQNPVLLGYMDTPGLARSVDVDGEFAFVADSDAGLQVIDISNPDNPQTVASVETPDEALDVTVAGPFLYLMVAESGMMVVDVSDPESPQLLGFLDTPGDAYGVASADDYILIADGAGLVITPVQCGDVVSIEYREGDRDGDRDVPAFDNRFVVHPNPFNPQTTITFSLERDEWAEVGIYELSGRRVAILADRTFTAGAHSLSWNGRDLTGRSMPSGAYLVRLETESGVEARKVMLVR